MALLSSGAGMPSVEGLPSLELPNILGGGGGSSGNASTNPLSGLGSGIGGIFGSFGKGGLVEMPREFAFLESQIPALPSSAPSIANMPAFGALPVRSNDLSIAKEKTNKFLIEK